MRMFSARILSYFKNLKLFWSKMFLFTSALKKCIIKPHVLKF